MNNQQDTSNLGRPQEQTLPTRLLRSPYFILRSPLGGYYLDPANNQNVVRHPEALERFLAGAQKAPNPACEMGEVKYTPRKNQKTLCYLHEGAIKEFEEAATKFVKNAANSDLRALRENFKLPDPAKEPDAYWVWGERFAPQLLILWGCEKEQFTSLPLVGEGRNVCSALRERAMSWTRLFREGIELSRFNPDGQTISTSSESLGLFLAFPVLDASGNLTHIDHLEAGQYKRTEVGKKSSEFSKARRLTRLPGLEVQRFAAAAREFYRQAHNAGCACPDCKGKASNTDPAKKPGVLTYQQELRRGFRLPDPDKHPDAYYIIGSPWACKLYVLCPHPTIKDAEEIAHVKQDVEWQEKKARTEADKQAAQKARQEYEEALALYNLYSRFFYTKDDTLCLVADSTLGLPTAKATKTAETMSLPVPGKEPVNPTSDGIPTVVDKLMKRRIDWKKIALHAGATAVALALLLITAAILYPRHLDAVVTVTNDPGLDKLNARNVLVIKYNNRLGGQSGTNSFVGTYTLRKNGEDVKTTAPRQVPGSLNEVYITLVDPDLAFVDGQTDYTLKIVGAHDIWGNTCNNNAVPVTFKDTRSPSLVSVSTELSDSNNLIRVQFDEPMSQASVENSSFYGLSGANVTHVVGAKLQKDRRSVILQADNSFQSRQEYTLILHSNLTDAAASSNPLHTITNYFPYATIPLAVTAVDANESQTQLKIEFNKPVNRVDVKNALKINSLQIGEITQSDFKSVDVALSDSAMSPSVQYVLQVIKLKDPGADAAAELTTNVSFTYTGSADVNPPKLEDDVTTKSNVITITFTKPVKHSMATTPTLYVLKCQGKTDPMTISSATMVSATKVQLALPAALDTGEYTIQAIGIEDLVGNKSDSSKTFSKRGIRISLTSVKALQIEGDTLRFRLAASGRRIDCNRISEKNFELAEDGKVIKADISLENNPVPDEYNGVEIVLKVSPPPVSGRQYQVHCFGIKLAGDSEEKETWVQSATTSNASQGSK